VSGERQIGKHFPIRYSPFATRYLATPASFRYFITPG
jgi:hypothetical protein